MKWKLSALVMVLAVGLLATIPSFGAGVLFEDKFATLDPGWGMASNIIAVKDGKLVISPAVNQSQSLINQANVFPNDMDASVTMNFATGPRLESVTDGLGLESMAVRICQDKHRQRPPSLSN